MNEQILRTLISLAVVYVVPATAQAQAPSDGAQANGSISTEGVSGELERDATSKKDLPWIKRYRPRAYDLELGVFLGGFMPDNEIELRGRGSEPGSWDAVAPSVGVRLGYYPLPHFGLEGEFAAMPTNNGGEAAFVYTARAQGVIQPGFWRITPFALLGGGALGVVSDREVVGNDVDMALHVGGGLKFFINDRISMRVEGRNVMSPRLGRTQVPAHSPEALISFTVRFGAGPKPPPPPEPLPDRDGDGVPDEEDHCPFDPGLREYKGCPAPDSDCDGFTDDIDLCPDVPGVAPDGCPPPDRDGDGIIDAEDECPDEPGPAPSGCPVRDSDGDGIMDDVDQCPNEPETFNQYQDEDGCPDELPEEVQRFAGTVEGIMFRANAAQIQPASTGILDQAVAVLKEYDQLRVEIIGHSDNTGSRDRNLELSQQRADAVKAYLVTQGIDSRRIETRGAGPDEPRADNSTRDGRALNRRIEFKLIQ